MEQLELDLTYMQNNGTKHDSTKARTDLLPIVPLLGAARVFGFGAKKYGEFNYRSGIEYLRLYGACLRHLFSWYEREDIDPESGLSHLDHALCSLMMLRQMVHDRPDLDNRYRIPNDDFIERTKEYAALNKVNE